MKQLTLLMMLPNRLGGAYRTEFYPTYEHLPVLNEMKKKQSQTAGPMITSFPAQNVEVSADYGRHVGEVGTPNANAR